MRASGDSKRITIKDIAQAANVSTATVSRVINDPDTVSPKRKEQVEKAIAKFHFTPNALARELITQRTRTIGVVIPDISNIFFSMLVKGLHQTLDQRGYSVLLSDTDSSAEREMSYLTLFMEKRVDAIVVVGTRLQDKAANDLLTRCSSRVPVLLVNDSIPGSRLFTINVDEERGAYEAVSYLASLGHEKIGFLNGEGAYSTYALKQQGYERALRDHGIVPNKDYLVMVSPYEEGGSTGARELLSLANKPTAIFTASDQIALGAYRTIQTKGYRIPRDISIMGFSGMAFSSELYPSLSTVSQYPKEMGIKAAGMILDIMAGKYGEPQRITLPYELLKRESCAPMKPFGK